MTAISPLSVQTWHLDSRVNGQRWLVRVESCRPEKTAIAIVLDLSDSCPTMREELARLPRLLAGLRRDTALWFYCLSRSTPLVEQSCNLGHLLDGSIDPAKWLDDSSLRAAMVSRGSLLRPVVEATAARKRREKIVSLTVLVLTDGELADFASLELEGGTNVVGILPCGHENRARWNSVLPDCSLFTFDDAAIDRVFATDSSPYYGACEVDCKLIDGWVGASVVDLQNRQVRAFEGKPLHCNLADQSLMLVLETMGNATRFPTLTIRSLRTSVYTDVLLPRKHSPADSDLTNEVLELIDREPLASFDTILDTGRADPDFAMCLQQLQTAKALCESHACWSDSSGQLVVWREQVSMWHAIDSGRHAGFDALLCVTLEDETQAIERLLLLGLKKSRRPAFQSKSLHLPGFDGNDPQVEISFNNLENRWVLLDERRIPVELNPLGSQTVSSKQLTQARPGCLILFSGSLK